MTQGVAGWGPVARRRPSSRQGPAQAAGSLAQEEEQGGSWSSSLRAELEEERLRTHELRGCFTAETREPKAALEREQQLLAEWLQSEWEQRQAQEVRWLQELNQRQRAAETCQLLCWKEAELREGQELLQRERTAAVRQTRDLQRQLAKETVRPSKSSREAQSKLQDILGKLPWEMDGYQPACICHLQNQLQLESRLCIKHILQRFEGELPASPSTAQPQGPPGHQGHAELLLLWQKRPQALAARQERPPESPRAGQQTTRKAVADAQLQVPEGEDLVLLSSKRSRLLQQSTRLQRVLEDLERQQSAPGRESCLLTKEGSPEACKEAERLQQKNAKLVALASRLDETSRQRQETIDRLINTHID